MDNSLIEYNLLQNFQNACLTGRCQLPINLKLLENWVENFARLAKNQSLDQEQFMFLSAGIIIGITNMAREFQEIKIHTREIQIISEITD